MRGENRLYKYFFIKCRPLFAFQRMPGSGEKESMAAASDDESKKAGAPNEKKHDSGAADLEKVTDYAEEKEIAPSSSNFDDALANIRK